ncbi:MAG: glycosyltransferase family 4 protein [bacterium]|nr:glycosyltransferase family 4 protein [bacterium]
MKKILFIITQGEMGGAQRNVFDLAANLKRDLYNVLVVTGYERFELADKCRGAKIEVKIAKHLKRDIHPWHDLMAILEIKKICKEYGPDILHLHSSKAGVLGSIAGALAGIKNIIFTAHGFHFLEPQSLLMKKISFWLEKFATLFRTKIICVSEFDRQEAIKTRLCPPEKLVTIHNGITLEFQNADFRMQIESPHSKIINLKSKITIGTIAHDYPTKNLKTLRAAFEIVKQKFPQAELKIIGRGSKNGEIENAAKLLPTFDIYVCSSAKEGFPYSILEAMAAGVPIVSTAVGGIPEAVEDGKDGLLVPPGSPQNLAEAIIKIIKNPELAANLARNAAKKVQDFSLEQMLKKTISLYRV